VDLLIAREAQDWRDVAALDSLGSNACLELCQRIGVAPGSSAPLE
jgi:hypothetical protein